MAISEQLLTYGHWWLLGLAAAIAGFIYAKRTPRGRQAIDGFIINAPIIGNVARKVEISRSLRTLGTMLNSGLQVLEAINLTAEASDNYLEDELGRDRH